MTPQYFVIKYTGGDVPDNSCVCTNVVMNDYRLAGIGLLKEVPEDMKLHFLLYPPKWGLSKTDPNIDHKRVP